MPALDPARRDFDSNRRRARDADDEVVGQLRQRFLDQLRDRERRPPAPATRVRMLEKTPKNALRIQLLHKVFPDARFIYLHRDPRQVLGSMLDRSEEPTSELQSLMRTWYSAFCLTKKMNQI